MENILQLVEQLFSQNSKIGYTALQMLQEESARSDRVYPYFDKFVEMIENSNSYIRSRGLILLAANARWDTANKFEGMIDRYLDYILDEKPITARQCIKCLPEIARYKPALTARIQTVLLQVDTSRYTGSMRPLVEKDITHALATIEKEKIGQQGDQP